MFKFIKQIFISTMMFLNIILNVNLLECGSMKNQECKVRHDIVNISNNDPIFYPFSIKVNKCSVTVIILVILMQEFVFLI